MPHEKNQYNFFYYALDILTVVSFHRQAIEYSPISHWGYLTLYRACADQATGKEDI